MSTPNGTDEPDQDPQQEVTPEGEHLEDAAPGHSEYGAELGTTDTDDETAAPAEDPTLAELLTGTARGDQAAFSLFYESTSDVVYGLALLMHAEADGAAASAQAVYQHLWDQAEARAQDLRLQTKASQTLTDEYAGFEPEISTGEAGQEAHWRPNEYELVLEWLVPLAHRIIAERFREGLAEPLPLVPVPQSEGGGVAGLPEEVLEDLLPLSDSQVQSLALTYLAGRSHQMVAQEVGAAVPSVKSRLRDAMTRLHSARLEGEQRGHEGEGDPILRAAVTADDIARGTAVNRNFTNEVSADLDKGLLTELAEAYALDAVDDAERALLDEAALTAEASTAQRWDTRVLATRRTLAEIFASHPVAPPSGLLDAVLGSVAHKEVGMGMVETAGFDAEETERQVPKAKRWMLIAAFVGVVLVGLLVWLIITAASDTRSAVEADEDAYTIEQEMNDGGEVRAVLSEQEDVGFIEFEDVPELDGEATYQVWLLPVGESPISSLGNFTADELESDGIDVSGLAQHRMLQITVEQVRNEETPQGDTVTEVSLQVPEEG
ncbi:anti-sigma factor domain-containing protein [Nesterenkonia sp. NBAIMH1]|uniref:anti-sigma factor domain-containing protein n=1 Tax=Nesterenkonia sp. NBAIMH1 TaxID=2600320 RepID=UPI0011B43003|nr:anti-sigma factor [Nesterenkonia sp. NBAIMH1]